MMIKKSDPDRKNNKTKTKTRALGASGKFFLSSIGVGLSVTGQFAGRQLKIALANMKENNKLRQIQKRARIEADTQLRLPKHRQQEYVVLVRRRYELEERLANRTIPEDMAYLEGQLAAVRNRILDFETWVNKEKKEKVANEKADRQAAKEDRARSSGRRRRPASRKNKDDDEIVTKRTVTTTTTRGGRGK